MNSGAGPSGTADGPGLWARYAAFAAVLIGALLVADTLWWHAGYARGDEGHVISFVQRAREGAPLGWDLAQGSIHRALLDVCMGLFPGRLWASSVPGLAGLLAEAVLLFAVGRRTGGSRSGFFAVVLGLASAFTLVRARVALSFSLFAAEWLFLVWLRFKTDRPWQWALWGAALAAACFDYEAWLPAAVLLLTLPFFRPLTWRQRAWEALGLLAFFACLLPPEQLAGLWTRRQQASLANPSAPSAGWAGLGGLIFGGDSLPYMAPRGHGVIPVWIVILVPLGIAGLGRAAWLALAFIGLGFILPLMGGATYGLAAHRSIAGWPVLVLLAGRALDRLAGACTRPWQRTMLGLVIAAIAFQQVWAWQAAQRSMDAVFRGPIRDLKRAADAGWERSRMTGYPLVTELHPLQGPQFRFLTGHPVPMPDAKAATIVAFLPWEYLPAVRKNFGQVATFQEAEGQPPGLVGVLTGGLAGQALEAERELRPVLIRHAQGSVASGTAVYQWLAHTPQAGPWARTLAVDYLVTTAWYNLRLPRAWLLDAAKEPLVSARPLLVGARVFGDKEPALALAFATQARRVDPYNGQAWDLEGRLLIKLDHPKELQALERAQKPYRERGLLFGE